ncbi:MAG TPA: SDR family oxidoreductase [Methanomassiliicoccales archaeon]|jgi:NAD(P)-dependent dehydrogenase (short-subunit alcohol dehydrogenase family)
MSKVILITGCSSGIGHATAHFFADEGWSVVATMRHPEQRQTDLKGMDNVDLLHLDVTDLGSVRDAVRRTIEKHGRIDVLVNNAGYAVEGVFEATTPEQVRRQFETNVLGLMDITREVIPIMRAQNGGTIVNVSSISGRIGAPLHSVYDGAKFAVEGFSEGLQYELRPFNIRVKLIEPGVIRTDFYTRSMDFAKKEGLTEYDAMVTAEKKSAEQKIRVGSPPERIALCIFEAVNDMNWKLRHHAGKYSGLMLALRRILPDRAFFALIRRSSLPKK